MRRLPSTWRTDFCSDIRLLDSAFVRFWATAGLILALLLPLVLFPLMIPVILGTIRCMENILRMGELGEALPWLRLLLGFDVIFLTLGVLLFDHVIES